MNIAVLTFDNPESACARYRVLAPLRHDDVTVRWAVQSNGDNHAVDSEALQQADLILVQRFFPLDFTEPLLEACFATGKPVIYDTDDLLPAVPEDNPQHPLAQRTLRTLNKFAHRFSAVSVSTDTLASAFAPLNERVEVTPNRLDPNLWPPKQPDSGQGPVRILYAGTPTHSADLISLEATLTALLDRYGSSVELILFGCSTPLLDQRTDVRRIPPEDSYAAYAEAMAKLPFDIGLAPLEDTPFNRAKSNVKWMEYAACGAMGVFSDLPPYSLVHHGRTGLLAGSLSAWQDCLETLIENPGARQRMADNAQKELLANHVQSDEPGELLALCYELTGNNPAR
ncbi:glycosyltransferase [uncultured Pseudodesulfovibrio sp.]|uniref:glycosyltransferase family protein n=1 Tax=uncultured Pseudodesulfovibrio sp. TaxID=2035858 RepID=UPI0029C7CF1E|nr:glycosyltransferase [uncultured Pseudodesulfovibrio sp.]